jgi:phage recombination protein Bet
MASNALVALTQNLAAKLSMGDGAGLVETLKATAFKGQVSDAQMTALLVVANQYGLNPWTKEIYAFPDKNNGIVPVVGVDGWSRIINGHPQFDGMDFEQDAESCTCIIYRKDRSHPVKVTEYMAECRRPNVGPWQSHPRRMLRHKAMIQCARIAFGYAGIYDQDEAERIAEVRTVDPSTGEILTAPTFDLDAALAEVNACADEAALTAAWKKHVAVVLAAKDKTSHTALKNAVAAKATKLKNPAQDVESRPVAEVAE